MAELEAATLPQKRQPAAFRARLLFVKSWHVGGDFAFHESLAQLEEAYALVESLDEPEAAWRDKIVFALADNYALVGRCAEAEWLYRRLLLEQEKRFDVDHARTHYTRVGLANAVARQGRHSEAQELLESAALGLEDRLGANHRQTLTALDMLADVHFRNKEFVRAERLWRRVHDGYAALMGSRSSFAITVLTNRALSLHRSGDAAAAEPLLRDALAGVRTFTNDEAPQVQQVRCELADCLLDLGRADEALGQVAGLDAAALNLAQPEPDWPERLRQLAQRLACLSSRIGHESTRGESPDARSGAAPGGHSLPTGPDDAGSGRAD